MERREKTVISARLHQPKTRVKLSELFDEQKEFISARYPVSYGRLQIEFDPLLSSIYKNIPSRTYSVPEKIRFIELVDDLAHQAGEWEALEVYRYLRKNYPAHFEAGII